MVRTAILTALITASLAFGQERPVPPPLEAFPQLKQNLELSTAQVDQLVQIMNEKNTALRAVSRQIAGKQGELQMLLHSESQDAYRVGQLMLDIHQLSTQPPPSNDQYRERALAVLTAEQRTKLAPLDQSLRLHTPASQAVALNLIDPPVVVMPVPLPVLTPAPAGRGR